MLLLLLRAPRPTAAAHEGIHVPRLPLRCATVAGEQHAVKRVAASDDAWRVVVACTQSSRAHGRRTARVDEDCLGPNASAQYKEPPCAGLGLDASNTQAREEAEEELLRAHATAQI